MAEHGSVQKEKVTEDYNDAYPLKGRNDDYEISICIYRFLIFLIFLQHQNDVIRMKNCNHQVHNYVYFYIFHMHTEPNSWIHGICIAIFDIHAKHIMFNFFII